MNNKKNDKVLIILSSLILIAVIITIIIINIKPKDEVPNFELPKDEIEIAKLLIVPKENSMDLLDINGNILDTIEGNTIFKVSEDNEILYLKDNALYSVNIEKDIDEEKNEKVFFNEIKLMDVKEKVYNFTFNNEYVAILTDATPNEETEIPPVVENATDLTKKIPLSRNHNSYDVVIINRNNNSKEIIHSIPADENIIIFGSSFIYNTEQYLNSYNFITHTSNQIYLGKDVSNLDIVNNSLIVFDKFGNGNKSSIILKLDENLNIIKVSKHDAINITSIKSENNNDIYFIDQDNKAILYILNMDDNRDSKKKNNLNTELVGTYTDDNTIYKKGYIYTAMNGKANIIDLKSSTIYKTYDIETTIVYPILESEIIQQTVSE